MCPPQGPGTALLVEGRGSTSVPAAGPCPSQPGLRSRGQGSTAGPGHGSELLPGQPDTHAECLPLGTPQPPPPWPPPPPRLQGDFLDQAAELIIKQFKEVKKGDVYYIESKKKTPYFDEEEGGE